MRIASGQPYTPTLDNSVALTQNSARKPLGIVADLRAERPAKVWGVPGAAFVRVFNAFDTRFFNGFVFPSSGQPDYTRFPGDPGQAAQLADPTRFNSPRRIELGVTLRPEGAK